VAFETSAGPEPFASERGDALAAIRVRPPGPESRALSARLVRVEAPAFEARRAARGQTSGVDMSPIVLAGGRGANVLDVDGNRYVDLAAGFGAALLGHGPSAAHAAVHAQLDRLAQGLGDLYASDVKVALLERLASLLPGGARALLCQSGADAVTAAMKTAVLATGKPGVIAFEGAYHGLGYAPLAACGFKDSFRLPFAAQLNAHVRFVPYPGRDTTTEAVLEALRAELARADVGAVLLEPILGRGGVIVPPDGFVVEVARLARAAGAVLIADEIWTGLGRSGSLCRSVEVGAAPDIVCFGKGLGASMPIAAIVGRAEVMAAWARDGETIHTSTHAGAPLGCAAALATLEELETSRLAARSSELGRRFSEALRAALASSSAVRDVRGAGLMIGVETTSGLVGLRAFRALLERGFLITTGGRAGEVLVATPPLTISEEQLFSSVPAFVDALSEASA
jgi:4-aminobutyrate aminotransferase/(S)-3-amino-2-methylpropionate transaminase